MILMHVEPWVAASTTRLGMMTSASSWVDSRSFLSMTIPLKISTGTDDGPVTRSLCFAVSLRVFPFSCGCSQIVLMICCLFSVSVRAMVWAGSGVEGVSLWRLLPCWTARDVLVALFVLYSKYLSNMILTLLYSSFRNMYSTTLSTKSWSMPCFGHWIIQKSAPPSMTMCREMTEFVRTAQPAASVSM